MSIFASSPLGINHPRMTEPEFLDRLGRVAVNKVANADFYTTVYAAFVDALDRIARPEPMRHYFFVDGELNVFSLEDAGVEDRCQEQVAEGTVPNQYGTWWYGRSNWCPGKEVKVETIDITDQVTPGSTATIEYYGYMEGGEDMNEDSSNVIVNSWLVIRTDP